LFSNLENSVAMVVQLGVPTDNDTYVHRVGRTARAGASGESILLCFDFEKPLLHSRFPRAVGLTVDTIVPSASDVDGVKTMIATARKDESYANLLKGTYSAYLGYQISMRIRQNMTPLETVAVVNKWILSCGCDVPPGVTPKQAYTLKGVEGLRIEPKKRSHRSGSSGERRGAPSRGDGPRRRRD
jgi:ATP-dependent RNA helicase MSS116